MIWVVILGFIVAAAWLAMGLAAIVMIVRGLRGERRADRVHCHPCGYSLDGLPLGQAYCPECGADLRRPRAVRARRERCWRPFILGCVLLALNALLLGMLGFMDGKAAQATTANTTIGANTINVPARQRPSPANRRIPNQRLTDGRNDSFANDATVDAADLSDVERPQYDAAADRRDAIAEYRRLVRSYEAMLHALGFPADGSSTRDRPTSRSREARLGFDLGVDLLMNVPAPEVRGDIARIVFHLAVRDRVPIADDLEAQIRQWHTDDPVDDAERARDTLLSDLSVGNNPFIADPTAVDQIADF